MKQITLIGAGGHGRVAADTAFEVGYENIEFLDKNWPATKISGVWPIIGAPDAARFAELNARSANVFISVGDNLVRKQFFDKLAGAVKPCLVHPSSVVSSHAMVNEGTLIVAGANINAFAAIGRGVILNTSCTIAHDCVIGDFVHVSPGANIAGNVTVGARSWVGIGAAIKEGVVIGSDVIIAAGAAVIDDVADGSKVMGVPARVR